MKRQTAGIWSGLKMWKRRRELSSPTSTWLRIAINGKTGWLNAKDIFSFFSTQNMYIRQFLSSQIKSIAGVQERRQQTCFRFITAVFPWRWVDFCDTSNQIVEHFFKWLRFERLEKTGEGFCGQKHQIYDLKTPSRQIESCRSCFNYNTSTSLISGGSCPYIPYRPPIYPIYDIYTTNISHPAHIYATNETSPSPDYLATARVEFSLSGNLAKVVADIQSKQVSLFKLDKDQPN